MANMDPKTTGPLICETKLCCDRICRDTYEFSHKSLAEYFVAFKFAAELGCLSRPFLETYREEGGRPCALRAQSPHQ